MQFSEKLHREYKNKKIRSAHLNNIVSLMNKNSVIQAENVLNICIHPTPTMGMGPVNPSPNRNHFTQLTCQFNGLQTVTALHRGKENEN